MYFTPIIIILFINTFYSIFMDFFSYLIRKTFSSGCIVSIVNLQQYFSAKITCFLCVEKSKIINKAIISLFMLFSIFKIKYRQLLKLKYYSVCYTIFFSNTAKFFGILLKIYHDHYNFCFM